jgi:hypothetical protein
VPGVTGTIHFVISFNLRSLKQQSYYATSS